MKSDGNIATAQTGISRTHLAASQSVRPTNALRAFAECTNYKRALPKRRNSYRNARDNNNARVRVMMTLHASGCDDDTIENNRLSCVSNQISASVIQLLAGIYHRVYDPRVILVRAKPHAASRHRERIPRGCCAIRLRLAIQGTP